MSGRSTRRERLPPRTNAGILGGVTRKPPEDRDRPREDAGVRGRLERLPWRGVDRRTWRLQDLLGPAVYDRRCGDLTERGLCLEMPAWGYHVFAMTLYLLPPQVS